MAQLLQRGDSNNQSARGLLAEAYAPLSLSAEPSA